MMLTLLLQSALLTAAPDTIRPTHDALHYDVTAVIGDTGRHFLGEVQTTWRLRSGEPVRVQLDTALRVVRVLVDGRQNTRLSRTMWGREDDRVVVPHQKGAGDSMQTRIRYHGTPRDGLVIADSAGARTAFADNWPDRAHFWLPSQDHPSDKATAAFHVEVPVGYQAIANGRLEKVDTLPRGRTMWHYRIDRPIPVYTMVVGVARFAITPLPRTACAVSCVPLEVWTYPADSAWAVRGPFRRAGDMVDFFSRLVGPFPYERLAHVQSTTRFGGMENSTAIFYDAKAYASRKLGEGIVAHETAHQWFGDAVTERDWHHLWLSEGFADYMQALWTGYADGPGAAEALMRESARAIATSEATARPIVDTAATDLLGLLNTNNYQKGSWVLHQLRGIVGDSAFFGGVRRYYETYRDSTVLSADFARVMAEASGQNLDWYFIQALGQPGYPKLDVTWGRRGGKLELRIRQTQPEGWGTYRIPKLEVLVDGKKYRVDVAGREVRQTLDGAPVDPGSVVVDPNGWWLLESTVRGGQ